jgi:large conductance mechanosensitive channel
MLKDFKEFAIKGNVIDMAVGIIVGAAFTTVVKSLVDDLLMPPLGVILGNVDFSDKFLLLSPGTPEPPYVSLDQAKKAGAAVLSYGQFINSIVSFLIVAFVLFLVVRWVTQLRRPTAAEPIAKNCPYCQSSIAIAATRCPQCTSQLEAKAGAAT